MEGAAARRGPPALPESRPAADALFPPQLDEAWGRAAPPPMSPEAPRDGEDFATPASGQGQGRARSGAGTRPGGGPSDSCGGSGSSCRAARGRRSPGNVAAGSRGRRGNSLKDFIDDSDDFFLDFQVRKGTTESSAVGCLLVFESAERVATCDLSNPDSHYRKHFKKNKEELAQKLYDLYNNTIFEQKLPEKMAIIWNKKMRKTAGYCVTGQTKSPEAKRYARIELSERVCDSADRLRDTLVHEACHAASWLINGVRDGHGPFWKFYAHKSTVIHPELPAVTRCHSYEINYKFTYQCVLCKAMTGRHSKSLDTECFMCAFCGGQLLLSQPPRKGDTPARTPLTPFAKYVKENYGLAKREQRGLSHGEVMRKLSADFALKTKLQDSL
ncbi:germ cell nuclear acidic protein [Indicator indicator]|uniref:germ cell nuclear acidic protein n=1 Tax=Indicator indicator TaxID=1002788 RepID=UPI0023DF69BA|nr:germ cell nuclear acidic protein [Indicator indicator]